MFSTIIIAASYTWRDYIELTIGCVIGIAIVEIIVAILSKHGKTKASRDAAKVKEAPKTDGRIHFCLIGPPRKNGPKPQTAPRAPQDGGIHISVS